MLSRRCKAVNKFLLAAFSTLIMKEEDENETADNKTYKKGIGT